MENRLKKGNKERFSRQGKVPQLKMIFPFHVCCSLCMFFLQKQKEIENFHKTSNYMMDVTFSLKKKKHKKKTTTTTTTKPCEFWWAEILKFPAPWSIFSSFCPQAASLYFAFLFPVLVFTFSLASGGAGAEAISWIRGTFQSPEPAPSWALAGSAGWSQTAVETRFPSGKANSGRCACSKWAVREGDQPWVHIK